MKDLAKRKRVMQRSMRLGHCICEPKKPCPCDVFREHDVCLCAGERLEAPDRGPVRLTQLVENAGCASKIDQAALKEVLGGLRFPADPRVLVGAAAGDDAGVYQLDERTAIVQTVDVFTPSVDDPYTFGQVAAANSVSDIYAMGGRPLTALSIVGFPIRTVPDAVLREILRGGIDKMAEAGVAVIGGHSIKDAEIKAGFAVTGVVDAARVTLRAGARPGDVLVLTKPLGTGILAFASQIGRARPEWLDASARSMAALNRLASERMIEFGAHGCTDVTGFGLMGHLAEMAAASGVDVEVVWDDLPLLPGVLECVAEGILPGSVERNRESSAAAVTLGKNVEESMLDVCMDAQTSGGLLIAVPARRAAGLLERLREDGIAEAAVIGKVKARGRGRILLRTRGKRPIPDAGAAGGPAAAVGAGETAEACCAESSCCDGGADACCSGDQGAAASCCDSGGDACCGGEQGAASPCSGGVAAEESDMGKKTAEGCCQGHGGEAAVAGEVRGKFQDFLRATGRPGALDADAKQAIAVALAVHARCEPCVRAHVRKARDMGFSQDQIDEAAWMAIAFGGSPVMMFYEGLRDA